MTGVDDIEEFSKVTINAVTENDHKELEKNPRGMETLN